MKKKNYLRRFETRTKTRKNTTFLHLVRDRRVYPIRVTHLQTMRQILFRTLWHTRRQRPLLNTRLQICFVTQLHTLLQTHSSFFCTWRFSPSNHKKIQLVYNWRLVYLSWVLVVCRTLRGFIIPPTLTPRAFKLLKIGSFSFPTFWAKIRSNAPLKQIFLKDFFCDQRML